MDINMLNEALRQSWCAETANGDWSQDNPSQNQCAITALIVQDYFEGDLLRCKMTNGDSHYWNRLFDGSEVDLTEDQFIHTQSKPLKEDFVIRNREYVLSFPDSATRYSLLKSKIEALIEN